MDRFRFGDGTPSNLEDNPAATSRASRMVNFQRNASFAAFMLVVVTCGFVLLVGKLKTVIHPLIWAAFFALPLQRAVMVISDLEIKCLSGMLGLCAGPQPPASPVSFWHVPGRKFVRVEPTEATLLLLEKVNNPFAGWPCHKRQAGTVPVPPNRATLAFTSCCRRRLRIKKFGSTAAPSAIEDAGSMLRPGGNYHLTAIHVSAEGNELNLELSVDGSARYPALLEDEGCLQEEVTGTFEVDKTSTFSWMFAIFIVIIFVLIGVVIFAALVYVGGQNLMDNLKSYEDGVKDFFDWIGTMFKGSMNDEQLKSIEDAIEDFLNTQVPAMAQELVAGISGFLMQALFMVIYLLFWLTEPIPVSSSVTDVFKSYLLLKSCVCLLFAVCMSLLLWGLHVKIWPLFFILSFLLNYIPEIGAILVGLLSVFVVLFDGSVERGTRVLNTFIFMVCFGIIKVVTGNVIELRMYANRGGEFMRMHPVVLLATMFCGQVLLGVSGMFLSVPMVAAFKYYLISADMPRPFLDPLLVFIEGNEMAPHMNNVDRRRAGQKDMEVELRSEGVGQSGQSLQTITPLLAPGS